MNDTRTATYEEFPGETVRDRLRSALHHDLLGPAEPDEVLTQSPNTRYLIGMLAPAGSLLDPTEDDALETEQGEEATDEAMPAYTSLDPSAIGLSFVVAGECDHVRVTASWGEYERREADGKAGDGQDRPEGGGDTDTDDNPRPQRTKVEWARTAHAITKDIPTSVTERAEQMPLSEGVELHWLSRKLGVNTVVSVFLVNVREAPLDRRAPDELWVYQPKLELSTEGQSFLSRAADKDAPDPDPDIASSDLVYRNHNEYATGHGVSTGWEESEEPGRTARVWTDILPDKEVPLVTHAALAGVPPSDMDALAEVTAESVEALLGPLLSAYETWINSRRDQIATIPSPHDAVARDHLKLAARSLDRMRDGISLLKDDPTSLRAFRFANNAMAEQLRRSIVVRARRRGEKPPVPEDIEVEWRPFQIGFILQCLRGLSDPNHPDRKVADLLWFPTGGGKTEAYLALTAFTLALRRLRESTRDLEGGAGTAVLMRYTLRLLTIQQFQRALTMICACERLRNADPDTWGTHRFTIGLWVGQNATPNSFSDSSDALKNLREGKSVYQGSPYQIVYCPWCGHDLAVEDYVADSDLERTLVKCRNPTCDFAAVNCRDGLPVLLVDEEIYRNPPSLLLATVDKFAQMPWNGRVQALFGRVDRHCPRHGFLSPAERDHAKKHRETKALPSTEVRPVEADLAPPQLIIQDELHLISGPLGTLVGLYEVAVHELCRSDGQGAPGPKVIASTATIRRARRQVEALFGRDVEVFPPLGLDADDSFFAKQADPNVHPGRLYVGVYAPGRSIKTALVRVYAALLSRAKYEFEAAQSDDADSYMTLVGYFNSLRELGGAVRLVEDDVPARLNVLRRRGFGPARNIFESKELTSRVRSSEIPERLKELERQFFDRRTGEYPIDVLLASNMLSVGVDIDRLGLMVVSGQPKTTAEYIQATSRVGRKYRGIVVEVFNWIRPRDTSHYERFRHYHDTFYRHVEATSVTPFSARARDRALPAVLASYVRLSTGDMSRESNAADFALANHSGTHIAEVLVRRAMETTGRDDVREDTDMQLSNLRNRWADEADIEERPLVYTPRGIGGNKSRVNLLKAMEEPNRPGIWPAARSLREVEVEVAVVLKDTPGGV